MSRPSVAKIDLSALRHNFAAAQALAPHSKTMPMVKANAYGHGAVAIAQALADIAPAFGVACIEEAIELRQAGINNPILLLEGTFSADEVELVGQKDLWIMVENDNQVDAIVTANLARPIQVWLGIDTGMHRLGFQFHEATDAFARLRDSRNVCTSMVIASHFASAEDFDNGFTEEQINRFEQVTQEIQNIKGDSSLQFSLANSAAILARPKSHRDWNRPGYMMFGYSPFNGQLPVEEYAQYQKQLKPVMTLESAVIAVRTIKVGDTVGYNNRWSAEAESKIATVAIGYGDGYPRSASDGTPVMINGVRCPLAGRVSMDMITVDVTHLDTVEIGNTVTLWGPRLPVDEIAHHSGTNGYELLTRMPGRVPRVYV